MKLNPQETLDLYVRATRTLWAEHGNRALTMSEIPDATAKLAAEQGLNIGDSRHTIYRQRDNDGNVLMGNLGALISLTASQSIATLRNAVEAAVASADKPAARILNYWAQIGNDIGLVTIMATGSVPGTELSDPPNKDLFKIRSTIADEVGGWQEFAMLHGLMRIQATVDGHNLPPLSPRVRRTMVERILPAAKKPRR